MEEDGVKMANVDDIKQIISKNIKENGIVSTIIGDIVIKKKIGEGGNSLVYDASWGKRLVAVKILAIDYHKDKESEKYKRFIDEFQGLIPLLGSGVIVPIYHFGLFQEIFPYFVMDIYPETLDSWIKKNPVRDIHNLIPYIKRLLYCLDVIHRHGIIHRDVKPKNIFVNENGEFLLGDFGIAWFDPEHYEKLAHTSKGDRLANYGFSAPEQFQKGVVPATTMDIFAIGQIVQWIVTGNTHGGTDRKLLSSFSESFTMIDPLIDKLLAYDPKSRPQSALDAWLTVEKIIEGQDDKPNLTGWRSIEEFDHRLAQAQPGGRGLIEIRDPQSIDQLLELLSQDPQKYELWWTRGIENFHIIRLKKQTEGFWVLNQYEFNVESVWIYRHHHALNKNFVLVKTAPLPSYAFSKKSSETEYAGYYNGFYFTRDQYEDGIAIIEDKRIELDSTAEPRCRELRSNFYFLCVRTGNILYMGNDSIVDSIYQTIIKRGFINDQDIEMLNNTQKDPMLVD